MKKIIIVLLALLTISCDQLTDARIMYQNANTPVYYGDFSSISNPWNIHSFITDTLKIVYKDDFYDEYYTPKETIDQGFADCEDFSRLFLNILFVRFGNKGTLVYFKGEPTRDIVSGGIPTHACVEYDGEIWDSKNGNYYGRYEDLKDQVMYRVFWDDIFIP